MSLSQNRVCRLLNIEFPLIQAGMVWVSGHKLATAAAQSGILGVIGAGSMSIDRLREHIQKARAATQGSLAVNVPLLYRHTEEQIQVALEAGIRIFITSAGSPRTHTEGLKKAGCTVLHVVSSPVLAKKCEDAGVDAVIAEGFEAGGHNGRDELTSFVLIPQVRDAVKIPVIAAGGMATGAGMVAAMALGAEGVQMGTRFIATQESSAHEIFKAAVLATATHGTMLCMKKLMPVRLIRNPFYAQVHALEETGADPEALTALLGKGRAKKGMLEGDWENGELEAGQVAALLRDCPTVVEAVARIRREFEATHALLGNQVRSLFAPSLSTPLAGR